MPGVAGDVVAGRGQQVPKCQGDGVESNPTNEAVQVRVGGGPLQSA